MEKSVTDAVAAWEGEGGADPGGSFVVEGKPKLTLVPPRVKPPAVAERAPAGTVNQIEWAEQIRARVSEEFDRVAQALKAAAARQLEQDRTATQTMIAILEEKRAEVLAHDEAGYFIHDWQELGGQVRQMVVRDTRYEAIRTKQAARRRVLTLREPM